MSKRRRPAVPVELGSILASITRAYGTALRSVRRLEQAKRDATDSFAFLRRDLDAAALAVWSARMALAAAINLIEDAVPAAVRAMPAADPDTI